MTTTPLRDGLPPLPSRMQKLAVDDRGYPVPWFVSWLNGKPEFRVADGEKAAKARRFNLCWVCGERVGVWKTFVIGPMCSVNRITSEPPCHADCAEFSATACPFLTLPKAQRREANLPDGIQNPGGLMILRNPGVTCLWTTHRYRVIDAGNGLLYQLGDPSQIAFFTNGRRATRDEVLASIDSGMPILQEVAAQDGPAGIAALADAYTRMLPLLPAA